MEYKPCRKCGADNPLENGYCKKCGAVLGVATSVIRAQRKPIVPEDTSVRWRWVLIGVPMMIGLLSVLNAAGALVGVHSLFGKAMSGGNIAGHVLMIAGMNIVSFFIGGAVLGRIAKRTATRESVIASASAMILLGLVGSVLTKDLLITALIAVIPSTAAAWAGARIGVSRRDAEP